MSEPIFSVILVNWNTAPLTCYAIAAVVRDATASEIPVEILVADNGSTDGSLERIRSEWPCAVVLEIGRNLGFSRAVNHGLSVHRGKHVILLNTDAILEPGALRAFCDLFEQHPGIGILGANLLNEDGTSQNSCAPFPSLATELFNKSVLKALNPSGHNRKVNAQDGHCMETDSVIGACLVIRQETLDAVGPLDERFFFFFEETDWCLRALKKGWKTAVAAQARVVHGQGKSSAPVLADSRIEFYRSRYRYFIKNKGSFQTFLLFEGLLLKLAIELLGALAFFFLTAGCSERNRRRLGVVAKLVAWHLRGCPRSWGLEGRFLRR